MQNLNREKAMDVVIEHRALGRSAADRESRARILLLTAAAISFLLSVSLWFAGHELQGIFVGLWVPSILSLGAIVMPRGGRR
jgi:hypothetical protein